jgi:YidC/Oxa1 family membrane protein insertase
MQWLFDAMAALMAFFYSVIPNYGISIVLLTLVVMVIVTPLTLKGTRSMMMMQQLQPEIRKIQAQYKDDRQKLNEELMAVYRENQINPVGGCLPLLVQAPVFIVLYTVLRGLTRRISEVGYFPGWVSGGFDTGSPSKPPGWLRNFDPAYLSPDTDMYRSLSQTNEMRAFGIDLAASPQEVLGESVVAFIPYALLILVVAVTGFVQQRQIQGRVPKGQVNSQQQMIMKILPIMLPIFSFTLPGGLIIYFAVSNMYRVGQQWFITRKIYGIQRGEDIDTKRARETGGKAAAVLTTAEETTESAASDGGTQKSRNRGRSPKGDKETNGSTGAEGAGGRPPKARTGGPSRTSGGTKPSGKKASGNKARRPSRGAPPAPSVQPRGRKKKRS